MAPTQVAARHVKPSFYAISANDNMILPDAEAFFAKRIGAKTVTLQASHAVMISQPEAVASFIEQAAEVK